MEWLMPNESSGTPKLAIWTPGALLGAHQRLILPVLAHFPICTVSVALGYHLDGFLHLKPECWDPKVGHVDPGITPGGPPKWILRYYCQLSDLF